MSKQEVRDWPHVTAQCSGCHPPGQRPGTSAAPGDSELTPTSRLFVFKVAETGELLETQSFASPFRCCFLPSVCPSPERDGEGETSWGLEVGASEPFPTGTRTKAHQRGRRP